MNDAKSEPRLLDTPELMAYTGLGRNNAMRWGNEIGARVQIGRRVLYDRKVIDRHLDDLAEENFSAFRR